MSKVLPLIATSLFTLVCGVTTICVDPAFGFLRYWAAVGTLIGIFLIRYILKSDEIWMTNCCLFLQCLHGSYSELGGSRCIHSPYNQRSSSQCLQILVQWHLEQIEKISCKNARKLVFLLKFLPPLHVSKVYPRIGWRVRISVQHLYTWQ